jgi:hypothetical protein
VLAPEVDTGVTRIGAGQDAQAFLEEGAGKTEQFFERRPHLELIWPLRVCQLVQIAGDLEGDLERRILVAELLERAVGCGIVADDRAQTDLGRRVVGVDDDLRQAADLERLAQRPPRAQGL